MRSPPLEFRRQIKVLQGQMQTPSTPLKDFPTFLKRINTLQMNCPIHTARGETFSFRGHSTLLLSIPGTTYPAVRLITDSSCIVDRYLQAPTTPNSTNPTDRRANVLAVIYGRTPTIKPFARSTRHFQVRKYTSRRQRTYDPSTSFGLRIKEREFEDRGYSDHAWQSH